MLLVDRKAGQPVRRLELRGQDGRVLRAEDTVVQQQVAPRSRSERNPKKTDIVKLTLVPWIGVGRSDRECGSWVQLKAGRTFRHQALLKIFDPISAVVFQQKIKKPRLAILDQLSRQRCDAEASDKPPLSIKNGRAQSGKTHDKIIDGKLPPSLPYLQSLSRKKLGACLAFSRFVLSAPGKRVLQLFG